MDKYVGCLGVCKAMNHLPGRRVGGKSANGVVMAGKECTIFKNNEPASSEAKPLDAASNRASLEA